jgi:tRNA nucleotidyltransferase (CCA-adding enzyme)
VSDACARLLLTASQCERVLWTYENVGKVLKSLFQDVTSRKPSEIYRALLPFRPEELLFLMGKAEDESSRRAVSHYFHRYRNVKTELKGKDLKAMGFSPGPIYKEMLEELLDARIDREVENRSDEFNFLVHRHPELFPEGPPPAEWKKLC